VNAAEMWGVTLMPASFGTAKRMVGSWQCQHCHLCSMSGWSGFRIPPEEDAPTCCYGERMLPYRIPSD